MLRTATSFAVLSSERTVRMVRDKRAAGKF